MKTASLTTVVVCWAALFLSLLAQLMPYVALTDLHGKIPPAFLTQALDDDGDGVMDAGLWDIVAEQVGIAIDGELGQRYPTPFTAPLPALVKHAAVVFAAEAIYARRVTPEQNPWMGQGNALRARLAKIAGGEMPLTPEQKPQQPSGSIISEPAKTFSIQGRMAC